MRAPKVVIGKSAVEMASDEAVWRDAMEISTSCAFCSWRYAGTAAEGRKRAAEHRRKKHPEVRARRRPGTNYRLPKAAR